MPTSHEKSDKFWILMCILTEVSADSVGRSAAWRPCGPAGSHARVGRGGVFSESTFSRGSKARWTLVPGFYHDIKHICLQVFKAVNNRSIPFENESLGTSSIGQQNQ